jgi:UDP-N-acetylmuramoyl-tripeptide--D-alanyl-D-alanine ligase
LSSTLYIGKNQKSYNSDIGIPLAVLGVDSGWNSPYKWFKNILEGLALVLLPNVYPKWLVVEAGIDHPGDMDFVNSFIKSDVVVFTKFPETPVHVEFFDSPQEVIKEKKKLIKSLKKEGVLVLNNDDKEVLKIREDSGKRAVTFGLENGADVLGSNLEVVYENEKPRGLSFKINIDGKSFPANLKGVLGIQHVYPVLGALAVGKALNLNPLNLLNTFRNYIPLPGRMRILDGIYGSTIIDDTYNSSPVALEEALKTLGSLNNVRKIAVLGHMAELGKYTKDEHEKVVSDIFKTLEKLIDF